MGMVIRRYLGICGTSSHWLKELRYFRESCNNNPLQPTPSATYYMATVESISHLLGLSRRYIDLMMEGLNGGQSGESADAG